MSYQRYFDDYPNLAASIGEEWLSRQFALPESERHLLCLYFQRAFEDRDRVARLNQRLPTSQGMDRANIMLDLELLSDPTDTLRVLEQCIPRIRGQRMFGRLMREMRSPVEEFLGAVSVAEFAAYFSRRGTVTLFPQIEVEGKLKEPDIEVDIEGRRIYVEVTTPTESEALRRSFGRVVALKERAPGQIVDEYLENFDELVKKGLIKDNPIIIMLDCSHSEIDEDGVEEALNGRLAVRFTYNRITRENVSAGVVRLEDTGIRMAPGTEMVSAVIWTKRARIQDGQLTIFGMLFENPRANNGLTATELARIGFPRPS